MKKLGENIRGYGKRWHQGMGLRKLSAFAILLIAAIAVVMSCCHQFMYTQAAKAKLNKKKVDLLVNNATVLKVKNKPGNVIWSSSDEDIASVKNGKVTGKKRGNTIIIAKVGTVRLSCKVSVFEKYSIGTVFKYLKRYLKKKYEKWQLVAFEDDAMEWKGSYVFPVRYQGRNTANTLVGAAYVDPFTGKTVFEPEFSDEKQIWKIFQ